MSGVCQVVTLSPRDYDAALFDLDGVLTRTATVHAAAWKKLFDDFLLARATANGEPFRPFDVNADYRRYVDGKPRQSGVISFLKSRGIELPLGSVDDTPDEQTVHALGKLKDQYFTERLALQGVERYEGAIALVRTLRSHDVRVGVVSSSNNCAAVLEAAGISQLFEARVDGLDVTRLALEGKPAPDAFLEGARRVSAEPARTIVIEDALAGVQAGRAGGFGLVIGVDRLGQSQALREAGADVVVPTLAQIQMALEPPSTWVLSYDAFDPAREGMRESLCTLGNGYFETRSAVPWGRANGVHYPGTYLAGGYNRLRTAVAGRVVENEDLVNFPNWPAIDFRIAGERWFDLQAVTLLSYREEFDLRRGLLSRTVRFEDVNGRCTALSERRIVSMSDVHVCALELAITAENWSGRLEIRSAIDATVVNSGAALYRKFNNKHLEVLRPEVVGEDEVFLEVRTTQSNVHVALAARTRLFLDEESIRPKRQPLVEAERVGQEFAVDLAPAQTLKLEKVVCLFTSRDRAMSECGLAARKALARAGGFGALEADHVLAWKHLWRRFDVLLRPSGPSFKLNIPMMLRLNMLHLLQAVSPNSIGLDVGVPARGWTGEAYQGHIFWDELFIFPFLNFRTPEITRSLLMYRYHRLGEARAAAARAGYKGAMFPWQSGSDGQEETQELNLNSRSGRWVPDNSYLQRHVGSAIAYNVWQYFQVTHDLEFLQHYGAELILDIARFWSSIALFDENRGRYEIRGVMGPDEFHEGYPGAEHPGLNNNAYTNIMAVWVLRRALDVLELLSEFRRAELTTQLQLSGQELARWEDITHRMLVPFHDDGIISQFEGYEELMELDWDAYRARYGNIQRLDLILEAENDSANRYKLSKQADVLMLFYLFSSEELGELLGRLGYTLEYETIPRCIAYYDCRSSHGSTLSRVVHAWVLARSDRPRAIRYFEEALQSDLSDIQQGTTEEGVHLGAMAGAVDLAQRVWTGIELRGDVLRFNPRLPERMSQLDMRIRYRGHSLDLRLTHESLTVRGSERGPAPITLQVQKESCELRGGETRVFDLGRMPGRPSPHSEERP
jgi:beta-phosphoglucomutase family hydrolase